MPFQFLPDNEFRKLGFRCGLEVHQQLLTAKKLFCRCPAGRYSPKHDAEVMRHMRPTLSELGEYDGTALMEFKTHKEVVYLLNSESVCTYEMDDAPPFELNEQALDIALELALLLECSIVGEIHISRKQYLDGSIPAGFQRTAIVGVDGGIPFRGRRIGIRQLAVEEDACREVSDRGHVVTFRTDRLSTPLSETVTEPHMLTPEEAAAAGWEISRLARVTGKVRRGIGAARQDVNVSIEGSTRVEIKGVPNIPAIERLVYVEAHRHKALLDIREALGRRGLSPETIRGEGQRVVELTGLFRAARSANRISTDLAAAPGKAQAVRAVVLRGQRGILSWPTQPGTTFAAELAGRVRVIACLDRMPNLFHSEQEPGSALGAPDGALWAEVLREAGAGREDAVVLVWGPERDARTAAEEVVIRSAEAAAGVPSETRQPLPSGNTDFERILPGPDRIYPDTDLPPKAIPDERIETVRRRLPAPPWEREERYRGLGLLPAQARALAASPYAPLFERAVGETGLAPLPAATLLLETLKGVARRHPGHPRLADPLLFEIFRLLAAGHLHREAVRPLLSRLAAGGDSPAVPREAVGRALADLGLAAGPAGPELAAEAGAAAALTRGRRYASPEARLRHAMGLLMSRVGGRVPGREASLLLRAQLDCLPGE